MVSYPDPNVRYDDHRLRTFGSGYETKGGGGGGGGGGKGVIILRMPINYSV